MDRSAAKAWVDAHIEPLMRTLGVPHWKITVSFDRAGEPMDCAGGRHAVAANCVRSIDYNKALITIDPDEIDDERHLEEIVLHELFHVVLSPFDLYCQAAERHVPEGPAREVDDRVWKHAVEQAVINLNRMWLGIHKAIEDERGEAVCSCDKGMKGMKGMEPDADDRRRKAPTKKAAAPKAAPAKAKGKPAATKKKGR